MQLASHAQSSYPVMHNTPSYYYYYYNAAATRLPHLLGGELDYLIYYTRLLDYQAPRHTLVVVPATKVRKCYTEIDMKNCKL